MFQTELANKNLYIANIGKIRLRLVKLQKIDKKALKLGAANVLLKG